MDLVGILNLNTQADLVATATGFGVTGRVAVQTKQLFNDGLRSFLGGNAVASTRFGYSPEGIVTFRDLRLNAPQFRVTRGEGRFDPASGRVLVSADATSTQYGPLFARVEGTTTDPIVRLRAPRPGVGVGLANLDARIVGRDGAYQVNATGGTTDGSFTADVLLRPGAQLAVDIRRVVFAGIDFAGRVVQTAAGPFAGGVRFAGQGLSGNVDLGAQGKYQRAAIAARAYAATIPGQVDSTIGRAIVNATVVLYDNAPSVVADAQVADMRYGPTVIQAARAEVNYTGGRGTAQALLTGSNGVPFRVAINSRLSPNSILVALQGRPTASTSAPRPRHGSRRRAAPTACCPRGSTSTRDRCASPAATAPGDLGTGAARQARPVAGQRADPEPRRRRAGDGQPRLCPERGRGDALRADVRMNIANFQRSSLCGRVGTGRHRTTGPARRRGRRDARTDPSRHHAGRTRGRAADADRQRKLVDTADAGTAVRRHPLQRPVERPLQLRRPRTAAIVRSHGGRGRLRRHRLRPARQRPDPRRQPHLHQRDLRHAPDADADRRAVR
ncbi:hypothetical protein AB5I41_00445 [Sphingomonas sp. MMS24-JH45]